MLLGAAARLQNNVRPQIEKHNKKKVFFKKSIMIESSRRKECKCYSPEASYMSSGWRFAVVPPQGMVQICSIATPAISCARLRISLWRHFLGIHVVQAFSIVAMTTNLGSRFRLQTQHCQSLPWTVRIHCVFAALSAVGL